MFKRHLVNDGEILNREVLSATVARRPFLTVRIFEPDSDGYNKIYTPLRSLLGIYIYLMPLRNFYKFQNYDSMMRLQVNLVFDFLV